MNHFIAEEISGPVGTLNAEESHHAMRVLRLAPGSEISVTQGDGKVYLAKILAGTARAAQFEIVKLLLDEERPHLHLAVAPTKSNDRFEFFLEKATEFGVAQITPLLCHHSERRVYKQSRGEKVIAAAVKQSKKGFVPQLNPLCRFKDFIDQNHGINGGIAYVAAPEASLISKVNLKEAFTCLIGPEGDFSAEEFDLARQAGFAAISLGKGVLRTETAALAVAAYGAYQRNL